MRYTLVLAAALLAAAANASASDLGDPFDGVLGLPLGEAEAAEIEGGDVRMSLNEDRSKLRVEVSAQKDRRTGHKKAGSERSYEVDAHNRVADTKKADYMPAGRRPEKLQGKEGLTARPERFPEGTWKVTGVKERKDKFGPHMVSTDAVGEVEVFDGKGSSLGRHKDSGYAIHSNTNDFSKSKSWGCIIVKEKDNSRIAATLERDIEQWGRGRQTLTVGRDK